MEAFQKHKDAILGSADLSRKGSVDKQIVHLVSLINSQSSCVTTSSCSGRICVIEQETKGRVKKQGCTWLYMTHDDASPTGVVEAITASKGNAVFKFEGFVLHVQCETLPMAQSLLAEAVAAGHRNSGMTVSKKGRITVAVRGTHSLEVPLTNEGQVLVPEEYISHIVMLANDKMEGNRKRIGRFYEGLQSMFVKNSSSFPPEHSKVQTIISNKIGGESKPTKNCTACGNMRTETEQMSNSEGKALICTSDSKLEQECRYFHMNEKSKYLSPELSGKHKNLQKPINQLEDSVESAEASLCELFVEESLPE